MRAVRDRAADPGRRRGAAETRVAAALLPPGLGVGLAQVGAIERVVRALAGVGLLGRHGLEDHSQIGLDPEHRVVGLNLAGGLALRVDHG